MEKIILNIEEFKQAEAILNDLKFSSVYDHTNSSHIKIIKLLKAREENIDFEIELAVRICGDNDNYPYRSSYYLTKFFSDLGLNYVHSGSTRRLWVENVLKQLSIEDISNLIEKGLFRWKDYGNAKLRSEKSKELSSEDFYQHAIQDFQKFINECVTSNKVANLIDILDLNINLELLFENKANTKDEGLNKLIEEAKNRFLQPDDKYIALEKLWDAFERIKTYYDNCEDKSKSADELVSTIAADFDKSIFDREFKELTYIGNNFRIRHHEKNKIEIKNHRHANYLFFRLFCLIDLCLATLKDNNQ